MNCYKEQLSNQPKEKQIQERLKSSQRVRVTIESCQRRLTGNMLKLLNL